MDDAVNKLNSFSVNVGPTLEKKIKNTTVKDSLVERNSNTMTLNPVVKKEILDIVKESKNKTSTDYNDLDMKMIKNTVEDISKPLTHIFNLSLQISKQNESSKGNTAI